MLFSKKIIGRAINSISADRCLNVKLIKDFKRLFSENNLSHPGRRGRIFEIGQRDVRHRSSLKGPAGPGSCHVANAKFSTLNLGRASHWAEGWFRIMHERTVVLNSSWSEKWLRPDFESWYQKNHNAREWNASHVHLCGFGYCSTNASYFLEPIVYCR